MFDTTPDIPTTLSALATAVPVHRLRQDEAADLAASFFGAAVPDASRIGSIFQNTGILERRMALPLEWYLHPRDWSDRNAAYLEAATALFIDAAGRALKDAGLSAAEIDTVVTVSSSGIATPSLEARVSQTLGFRPDILRVPVFGLGCAGGISGLSIAERLARAEPGRHVLLVVVELNSLAFRAGTFTKANIISTALFGDGAAAAIISGAAEPGPVTLGPGRQHTYPDTLDTMGWAVDAIGLEVMLDRTLPPFARTELRPVLERFISDMGFVPQDLTRLSFHPGGTKVLEAIEAAFGMQTGTLDIERQVLRDYGNMSAPTALFVLARALKRGGRGPSLITALGPGFTAVSVPVTVQ